MSRLGFGWVVAALLFVGCDDGGSVDSEDASGGPDGSQFADAASETDAADGATPDAAEEADLGGGGGAGGEFCPGVGDDCTVGDCTGTIQCNDDDVSVCVGDAEICNDADDDCDGEADEGFDVGGPCRVDDAPGSLACGPDGGLVCVPGDRVPEVCDGDDDDSDGRIDEGDDGTPLRRPCYDGPEGTVGVGVCVGGISTCQDGGYGACVGATVPTDELCDGADNNCDGTADEGALDAACYEGGAGTEGVGLCRGGRQSCAAGGLGACVEQVLPGIEVCDTLDNDCDGAVDEDLDCGCEPGTERECYSGPEGTAGQGACIAGRQACVDRLWGACNGQRLPGNEVCDSEDNDCDGQVDDDVVGVGEGCVVGIGECARDGVRRCQDGLIACVGEVGAPANERCDGADNDCDGSTDEGFRLGEGCVSGQGACAAEGVRVCADDEAVCDAVGPSPNEEVCNDIDDDCDGIVDEVDGVDAPCVAGVGACAVEGAQLCGDGALICGASPGVPGEELCDGIDNNCDGQTDEGDPGAGRGCETGAPGACAAGVTACAGGGIVCTPDAVPEAEVCDGLDNDCNGVVDDDGAGGPLGQACYDGAAGTAGQGPCRGGFATCQGGRFGACVGQVLPGAEVCDSLDNDCNGAIDDVVAGECACEPNSVRECYTGAAGTAGVGPCRGGRQTCRGDGQSYGPCVGEVTAQAEICDGVDNDCNGLVDDAPGVGEDCDRGVGACNVSGALVCRGDRLACDAVPGMPGDEICDGEDRDCNGAVDDVAGRGDRCEVGVGLCRRQGERVCADAPQLQCSAAPGPPVQEACNAQDDDCDGTSDEGFDLGQRCVVGVGACEAVGRLECDGRGGVRCSVGPAGPGVEVCNGLDDDCDGVTDEDTGGAGCATGEPGICARGRQVCARGQLDCVANEEPGEETCNGLDDDCNGAVDDGGDGPLARACYEGPDGTAGIGPCRGGEAFCRNGRFGVCVGQITPTAEVCDEVDNDCNGRVDDVGDGACVCQPGSVRDCYSGRPGTAGVGICRMGRQTCRQDGQSYGACEGEALPEVERCDGRDADCNGRIDDPEGFGTACSAGQGECRAAGRQVCDVRAGRLVCDADPGEPVPEVCNGLDDNCDGAIDDVIGLGDDCAVGEGACTRTGALTCDLDRQRLVCDARPGAPREELCNEIDDDCDGETDEAFGLGERCSVGVGACQAAGVLQCARDGGVECSGRAGEPTPEQCDGVDNDCDGGVDERLGGAACDTGVPGVCRSGVTRCVGGELTCDQRFEPSPEVCDGADNDCNGRLDDDPRGGPLAVDCYDGPRGTEGVGLCRAGERQCINGRFGACLDQVLPAAEICDSQDNDCNRVIDDLAQGECVCEPGSVRACYRGPLGTAGVGICRSGLQRCVPEGTNWGACDGEVLPARETCDGVDQDCDNEVDEEPLRETGGRCSVGVGACFRAGNDVCSDGEVVCNVVPGRPRVELCNEIDDDCDAKVDEGACGGEPDCQQSCEAITTCLTQPEPDYCRDLGERDVPEIFALCRNLCAEDPRYVAIGEIRECREQLVALFRYNPQIEEACGPVR